MTKLDLTDTESVLLQISDLHIGSPKAIDKLDPGISRLLPFVPFGERLTPHDQRSLDHLAEFCDSVREACEDRGVAFRVVNAGDHTQYGAPEQFDAAMRYYLPSSDPTYSSLREPGWDQQSVPGNHDHWPGINFSLGAPTGPIQAYISSFHRTAGESLSSRHRRWIFVDSDCDVKPNPWLAPISSRFWAIGSFVSQLKAIVLQPREPDEIRVLVIHHTMDQSTRESRRELSKFLVVHEIGILITGHTHQPRIRRFAETWDGRTQEVLETNCGTTAQMEVWPAYFHNRVCSPGQTAVQKRKRERNSLIIHRLQKRGGGLEWSAEVKQLGANGFADPVRIGSHHRGSIDV